MTAFLKNVETGKFHRITMLTWTEAEYDEEAHDSLPPGVKCMGDFVVENGVVRILPMEVPKSKKATRRSPSRSVGR